MIKIRHDFSFDVCFHTYRHTYGFMMKQNYAQNAFSIRKIHRKQCIIFIIFRHYIIVYNNLAPIQQKSRKLLNQQKSLKIHFIKKGEI